MPGKLLTTSLEILYLGHHDSIQNNAVAGTSKNFLAVTIDLVETDTDTNNKFSNMLISLKFKNQILLFPSDYSMSNSQVQASPCVVTFLPVIQPEHKATSPGT